MTPTLPFLYLPDAFTLVLLMLVLDALRRVAVLHIRQELLVIRKEMLAARLAGNPAQPDPAYHSLRSLVDSSIRLAPRLSPARMLFIYRFLRKSAKRGQRWEIPELSSDVFEVVDSCKDIALREKLKRLSSETSIGVGTFFLMGSLSGWAILLAVVPRMVKRTVSRHQDHRTDAFFDLTERILGRFGRRAQKIGALTNLPPGRQQT